MSIGTEILATGHYAPERRVLNAEIEASLGLEAGWIEGRTGIRERRFASDDQALTDIAANAGEMALARTGLDRSKIALTILATSTPDHLLPPSAPLLAHKLGLTNSGGIDMAGACAGFLYALTFADSFVRTHNAPVLIVAANILSRRINPKERASAILFADAAGAVLLAPTDRKGAGVLGLKLMSDGASYGLIQIPVGGSRTPFSKATSPEGVLMTITSGQKVFTKAVDMMATASQHALTAAGLDMSKVDHFIPHQANQRMISAVQKKLGLADDKTISTVASFANSSAATIPFSLSLAAETRAFQSGQTLLFTAAGAGLLGGAIAFGL